MALKKATDGATATGEETAEPVRDHMWAYREAGLFVGSIPDDNGELLNYASMQLAGLVTSGLVRCKQTLVAAPGVKRDGKQVGPARDFRYRTEPTDLIGAAHEQLAWLVVSKEEARVCKGCGRWFLPSHGSQKHHAKDCGNSRRQRELRQRRKAGSSL